MGPNLCRRAAKSLERKMRSLRKQHLQKNSNRLVRDFDNVSSANAFRDQARFLSLCRMIDRDLPTVLTKQLRHKAHERHLVVGGSTAHGHVHYHGLCRLGMLERFFNDEAMPKRQPEFSICFSKKSGKERPPSRSLLPCEPGFPLPTGLRQMPTAGCANHTELLPPGSRLQWIL